MKKINIALILSLLVMYMGYEGARGYILLKKGARLSAGGEYDMADEVYDRLAVGIFSREALRNKVINLYRAGRYEEITKIEGEEKFIRGNSYSHLGDQSNGVREENYKKSLEKYRLAMEETSDINIKINYEIVMKKLKDQEQKQKQKEEKQKENQEQNKDKSQQDKDQKEQQRQDKKDQNSGETEGDKDNQDMEGKSGQDDSSGDKEAPEDKQKDASGDGDNSSSKDSTSSREESDEKGDLHRREAMTILEGLERNESQAFKNNERLERTLGGEEEDESW